MDNDAQIAPVFDEDLAPEDLFDTDLDSDDATQLTLPDMTASGDGITDGTVTTDLTDVVVSDPATIVTVISDEATTQEETDFPDELVTGFNPVNYTYDDNGNFVNLDLPTDNTDTSLVDTDDDEETPDGW